MDFLGVILEQVTLVLDKVYSVLVDRRGWVTALTVLAIFGVINVSADEITQSGEQLGEIIVLVTKLVTAISALMTLLWSWTKREPSGTSDYKASRERMARWGGSEEVSHQMQWEVDPKEIGDAVDSYLETHSQTLKAHMLRVIEETESK